MELLRTIFTPGNFEPHSVHFVDMMWLVWVFYISNGIIALAYAVIPVSLLYILSKRKDIPFNWVILAFSGFILFCGITHVMHIVVFTYPLYYLEALFDVATAIVSIFTAYAFLFVIPDIVRKVPNAKMLGKAQTRLSDALSSLKEKIAAKPELEGTLGPVVEMLKEASADLGDVTLTLPWMKK